MFTPTAVIITKENIHDVIKELDTKFGEVKIVNLTEMRCYCKDFAADAGCIHFYHVLLTKFE